MVSIHGPSFHFFNYTTKEMHKTGFKACIVIAQIFFLPFGMQSLKKLYSGFWLRVHHEG